MSGALARGEPRSVGDPDKEAYDAMIQEHKRRADGPASSGAGHQPVVGAKQPAPASPPAKPATTPPPPTAPQSFAESAFGFARKGRKEWEDGHPIQGMIDAGSGLADLIVVQEMGGGLLKGGLKLKGPMAWRSRPWEEAGFRKWLGEQGFLKPGQHGHHSLIPNNGWGKQIPDWFKHQPWNIKPMESPVMHGRIHGKYMGLPQFNVLERYWYGTPLWWKALNGAVLGAAEQEAAGASAKSNDR